MKYEGFQESNFIKIKNSNLSNFIEFKYSIEQSNLGRKIQGQYIKKFIRSFFNIFTQFFLFYAHFSKHLFKLDEIY